MKDRGDNRLVVLAVDIRRAHDAVNTGALAVAERAIAAGHALIEAKSLVRHGQWRSWLQEHCGLSERSAQRYMQLANSGMKSATVADLGIRGASRAIARRPPKADLSAGGDAWMAEMLTIWRRAPLGASEKLRPVLELHVETERALGDSATVRLESDRSGKPVVTLAA